MARADDDIRLRHMLDAAREALAFSRNRKREDLDADRVLTLALVKCIEIVGEAGARVAAVTRAANPLVPWTQIVGMRHHLVHVYFDIDLDRLWTTVTDDLPPLVAALERILSRPTG